MNTQVNFPSSISLFGDEGAEASADGALIRIAVIGKQPGGGMATVGQVVLTRHVACLLLTGLHSAVSKSFKVPKAKVVKLPAVRRPPA